MMKSLFSRRRPPVVYLFLVTIIVVAATTIATVISDCEKTPRVQTAVTVAPPPAHQRIVVPSFRGISEPQADAWRDMLGNIERLKGDYVNTVAIQPPVLISLQAGRQRRVALEGDAVAAARATADFHQAGMAVMIAPTVEDYLFPRSAATEQLWQMLGTSAIRKQLDEDVLKWASMAEAYQVELFAPLGAYNLALGSNDAASSWGQEILPRIRERYSGPLAASVVANVNSGQAAGEPYDFERLDYRGYDYLMLAVHPEGESFDPAAWQAYVDDLLARAEAVVSRDGLKGVIVGDFGGWREDTGAAGAPALGADGQAQAAAALLETALPRTAGFFYNGWTLPGRGAKDAPVEEVLRKFYGM